MQRGSNTGGVVGGGGAAAEYPPAVVATFPQQQPMQQLQQPQQASEAEGMTERFEGVNTEEDASPSSDERRKELYGYEAPFPLYSAAWSPAKDAQRKFRLAVASFVEEYSNRISIVQLDEEAGSLVLRYSFYHPYPPTKVQWMPDPNGVHPDLIATSGDYLRLWRVGKDNSVSIEALLNPNRNAEYCAPLTSFDWNTTDVNLIGTSSIDTTCTIWSLETGQAIGSTKRIEGTLKTQLIAHDKEVFDMAFSHQRKDSFASVGADGSIRLFDLRHLEHSTIVYEDVAHTPLLRIDWNKMDANYLATIAKDSKEIVIVDLRMPCTPVARLSNHKATVNAISWAPHSSCHICSGADDSQALIWDINEIPKPVEDPILAYQAKAEVNQVHWSSSFSDWISICYGNRIEILRV
ncbi:hypothetical protein PMAYCL1PPCAC_27347 [Pristionchus mayeri]|uniref:Uncharacterized protein n=1 Tax=Pristionchus mayeri TaxID=1317129 RepID=A0AAN5D6V9_9BILA|nr:hypothetical protein PMAYCL1PPCAC_27347 [Pristionchus mayeri]